MRKIKFLSAFSVVCTTVALCLLATSVRAGNVHWSVNVGVPVVAAPAPAIVYAVPAAPVVSVVRPAPVVVYPHATRVVARRAPAHRWHGPGHAGKRHVRPHHR